jgi:transcriptional regulator with XRE-family HTH domain
MEKNKNSAIAAKIKYLRRQKGITQKTLAEETGLSKSAIISYENGVREPNSKAMAALEGYFQVTGEYLRGEKDNFATEYIWHDKEVMDAVNESFPTLLNKLLNSTLNGTNADQKIVFDILVEICHISSHRNAEFKTASLLLIEDALTYTTRFIDFCSHISDSPDFESARNQKFIQDCVQNYEKSLSEFYKEIGPDKHVK